MEAFGSAATAAAALLRLCLLQRPVGLRGGALLAEGRLRRLLEFPVFLCLRPEFWQDPATAEVLQQVPGLEWIRPVLFPDALVSQIDRIPGVTRREYRDTDSDDKSLAAESFGAQLTATALAQ